jgi:alkylresorcinol/alkylpyrone synthase
MPQALARDLAAAHFAAAIPDIGKYVKVFKSALVEERYFCVEADWFGGSHSLAAKNGLYLDWAKQLALAAIERCLAGAAADPGLIDTVIFISSSGIATPSLDVAVINALDLAPSVRRVPLFGLGCAGGAAGLALAGTLASARSDAVILLVAVELNSLTFQPDDLTKSNFVAASLFGDGAAAVLVRAGEDGPVRLLRSATLLRRRTNRLMGWDFVDGGFRVVFSRRVPEVIKSMMPGAIGEALAGSGVEPGGVRSLVFHPGGTRILEAYQSVLGRPAEDFRASYHVLARYGNMSSATVLFVLEEEMRGSPHAAGDHGLLAAFGPGFSAEVSLLEWV